MCSINFSAVRACLLANRCVLLSLSPPWEAGWASNASNVRVSTSNVSNVRVYRLGKTVLERREEARSNET
jgi:hypothetical protein